MARFIRRSTGRKSARKPCRLGPPLSCLAVSCGPMSDADNALLWNYRRPPRRRRPGELIWTLRKDHVTWSCELHSRGAGRRRFSSRATSTLAAGFCFVSRPPDGPSRSGNGSIEGGPMTDQGSIELFRHSGEDPAEQQAASEGSGRLHSRRPTCLAADRRQTPS